MSTATSTTMTVGVTRNRTVFFQQCRSSNRQRGSPPRSSVLLRTARTDEKAGLIPNAAKADGVMMMDMAVLPPRWVDLVEEINDDMKIITRKLDDLEALHTAQLRPSFAEKEREQNESTLERITGDITRSFHLCHSKIKRLESEAQSDTATSAELKLGQNVQRSMAAKLQDHSQRFRSSQSGYIQKIRGRYERNSEKSAFEELGTGAAGAFDIGYTDQQLAVMVNNDREITQREAEINDIAKSIFQLADIFKELQTLVVDQGTMLDRIDYNIDQTVVQMKEGHRELTVGEKYQKSARAKYCILLLGAMACVLVLAVIAKNQ